VVVGAVGASAWLQALQLAVREVDWRALRVSGGLCPLCSGRTFIRISRDLLGTRCLSCKASPISMAIGAALAERVPSFADQRVCELSARGPFFEFLKRSIGAGHGTLACSEFFDGVASGEVHEGVQCQDVQRLTYADASFDVCTSTEVFEHVPDDRAGFAELHRVTAAGGHLLLTVPLSDRDETVERATLEEGLVRHLQPPTWHDDRIRGTGRVLVYRDYGRDITDRLARAGFSEPEIVLIPDPAGRDALAQVVTAKRA
jgi:SAM-dependent methyltransferase